MEREIIIQLQEKKYQSLGKLTTSKIIDLFIESENEALLHKFQGQFYPYRHYDINATLTKALKGIDKQKIIDAYFHASRLGIITKVKENNYPLFLKGIEKTLSSLGEGYNINVLRPSTVYVLFGVNSLNDIENLYNTKYSEFLENLKFVIKVNSYTSYPSLRKRLKASLFLENEILLKRAQKITPFFNEFNFETAGALVLLLTDSSIKSKQVLLECHKRELSRETVWVLGSFYKDFKTSEANKLLLNDLYNKYPTKWINEYYNTIY
ncbi:hypothetical protein HER15_01220 [Tenacibaculum mesophilum]|uniref:Uncharacterized protein n=1 Tax=Tenacibaculum mesophilum TaxID=104268 RepID=A0AAE9ML70_9FLAO|nr:hypothetical protein [Tenacibaculum mesophilum]UTD14177.1 hypothetical protein HER15_01220 [Tenacibaculum mesophilum]